MKIYQVLDGIWAARGEEQGDVGLDDDEPIGDDEEADIRVIEEGDEPILRGVDEHLLMILR